MNNLVNNSSFYGGQSNNNELLNNNQTQQNSATNIMPNTSNGKIEDAIKDYICRYRIDESRFIDFIEEFVSTGLNPNIRQTMV